MGHAFMLKKYAFQKLKICFEICLETSKYILKIETYYLHALTVILIYFIFFKVVSTNNKMDNYNNTETFVQYLLGVKNSEKSH